MKGCCAREIPELKEDNTMNRNNVARPKYNLSIISE
jgi:hypothetical protein